jgi:hypothetical protein
MYFAPSLFPAGGPFLPSLSVNLYFAPSPGPREHFPGGLGLGGPHWHPQLPPPLPASRLCIPMSPRPLPLPEVVAKKAFQHVLERLQDTLEALHHQSSCFGKVGEGDEATSAGSALLGRFRCWKMRTQPQRDQHVRCLLCELRCEQAISFEARKQNRRRLHRRGGTVDAVPGLL